MMRGLLLLPALLVLATCAPYRSEWIEETVKITGMGSSSFALHVAVTGDYDLARGRYDGIAINRSTNVDCTAAFYRFRDEPSSDDMPILHAGLLAPAELPGGGILVGQRNLPRSGERQFVVPVQGTDEWIEVGDSQQGDPELDEWLVGLTCPEAELEITLNFTIIVEKEGRETPLINRDFLDRSW